MLIVSNKSGRKIRAMVLNVPVDRCLGVVQCDLPGCEAYLPLIVDDDSATDQVTWFLDNHESTRVSRARWEDRSNTAQSASDPHVHGRQEEAIVIDVRVDEIQLHPDQATNNPGCWAVKFAVTYNGRTRTFWRWHTVRGKEWNGQPMTQDILRRFWDDTFAGLHGFSFDKLDKDLVAS